MRIHRQTRQEILHFEPEGQSKIDEKIIELADFMDAMKFLLDIKPGG